MLEVSCADNLLIVSLNGKVVIRHSPLFPFLMAGRGVGRFRSSDGHWSIKDSNESKTVLTSVQYNETRSTLHFSGGDISITFHLAEQDGRAVITIRRASSGVNRLWLLFPASSPKGVFGGGAQYGSIDLTGRRLPLWVQERRIGRESARGPLTGGVGQHATFFPLPCFFTYDGRFVVVDHGSYGVMDFRGRAAYCVELWELPRSITLGAEDSFPALLSQYSKLLGRQPVLQGWVYEGVILESRGGEADLQHLMERTCNMGIPVTAVCLRDWSGSRDLSGRRKQTFFDWVWSRDLYPHLDRYLSALRAQGIHALAYINPHLSIEGRLFAEASLKGYLVQKPGGGNYISDVGGFMAGHIDLSRPDAVSWLKEIVVENILKLGFSGLVADMGEFLPADAVVFGDKGANALHNRWPVAWSRLIREAIRESGLTSEAVFFSRSGYFGSGDSVIVSSTGEHNTSWGKLDGLPSALAGALSLSCSGIGLSYSDVGGNCPYITSRSPELFLRWAEYAAFTPIMKTVDLGGEHAGYDDEDTLNAFSRLTRIHAQLAPYLRACVRDNALSGIPIMRPLFFAFPGQPDLVSIDDQYMLGEELMVAPALQKKQTRRTVVFPKGTWVSLWDGKLFSFGTHRVATPLGRPPVYYRSDGKNSEFFASLTKSLSEE